MAKKEKVEKEEPIPQGQAVLDNMWLLFLLSLLISGVLYNAWGVIDIMRVTAP